MVCWIQQKTDCILPYILAVSTLVNRTDVNWTGGIALVHSKCQLCHVSTLAIPIQLQFCSVSILVRFYDTASAPPSGYFPYIFLKQWLLGVQENCGERGQILQPSPHLQREARINALLLLSKQGFCWTFWKTVENLSRGWSKIASGALRIPVGNSRRCSNGMSI